jgi:dynein heavy chain
LNSRLFDFDKDFNVFRIEIDNVELAMQKFVKDTLAPMPTADQRLLCLNRFEQLNLDCLCLDRRYLDAAEILEKEIAEIKD